MNSKMILAGFLILVCGFVIGGFADKASISLAEFSAMKLTATDLGITDAGVSCNEYYCEITKDFTRAVVDGNNVNFEVVPQEAKLYKAEYSACRLLGSTKEECLAEFTKKAEDSFVSYGKGLMDYMKKEQLDYGNELTDKDFAVDSKAIEDRIDATTTAEPNPPEGAG